MTLRPSELGAQTAIQDMMTYGPISCRSCSRVLPGSSVSAEASARQVACEQLQKEARVRVADTGV